MTTFALQRDRRQASPDDFPAQLAELLAYLDDRMPPDHPFARLAGRSPAFPSGPSPGCSDPRARARCGQGSSGFPTRSRTSSAPGSQEVAALYRDRFAASGHPGRAPYTAVAVWVICADTDEQARRLAASGRMTFTMLRRELR